MMNFEKIRTRPRVFQQLTGFTVAAFETLLAAVERASLEDRQQRDRQRSTPRQRRPGGGRKGTLLAVRKVMSVRTAAPSGPYPSEAGVAPFPESLEGGHYFSNKL